MALANSSGRHTASTEIAATLVLRTSWRKVIQRCGTVKSEVSMHVQKYVLGRLDRFLVLAFFAATGPLGGLVASARADDSSNCYNLDACSESIACQYSGSTWFAVSPSGKKLWKAGLQYYITCARTIFIGANCTGAHWRDDYTSRHCNVDYTAP